MLDLKFELYDRLETVQSKSLVKTVREILRNVDEKFWTDHCSNRDKHPPEDQGEGGLLRHTIKCTYIFEEISRRERFEDYEFDAGMSATILHDIKKNGKKWGKTTDYKHGIIGAEFIKKFYFADKTIKKLVMNSVRYHMAPWNTTFSKPRIKHARKNPDKYIFSYNELMSELEERTRGLFPNKIEKAVQESDYWGSRKNVSFYPGVTVMPDNKREKKCNTHDSPEEWVKEILGFNKLLYLKK